MKLSPQWIRDFVDIPVDDRRLAEDLTSIGIAVEGTFGEGANTVFEMEIGTNRPDAMNHYGVAREAAALYGVELKPLEISSFSGRPKSVPLQSDTKDRGDFEIGIDDSEGCARYRAQILRGVTIKFSPQNISSRLALVDQRAINNA